jgi:hypothetical protein
MHNQERVGNPLDPCQKKRRVKGGQKATTGKRTEFDDHIGSHNTACINLLKPRKIDL